MNFANHNYYMEVFSRFLAFSPPILLRLNSALHCCAFPFAIAGRLLTLVECLTALESKSPTGFCAWKCASIGLSVLENVCVAKFKLRCIVTSCPWRRTPVSTDDCVTMLPVKHEIRTWRAQDWFFITPCVSLSLAYDHTTLRTPVLVRSPKLSNVRLS